MLELQTQEILIYDPSIGQHVPVYAIGAGGAATVDPTLSIPGAAADAAAAGAALQETLPTPEERLAKLEAENADLKEALELLLSGVTDDG